jgi:hypothetical protein
VAKRAKTEAVEPSGEEQRDREIREFYESRRGDVAGLEPVAIRVAKGPRTVFSLRLAPSELDELARVAAEEQLTLSDFIRRAALKAARSRGEGKGAERSVRRELVSAVESLQRALGGLPGDKPPKYSV